MSVLIPALAACLLAIATMPVAPPAHAPSTVARLAATRPAIRRNLDQVAAFWYPRTIDRQHGGYLLAFDAEGRQSGQPAKMIVSQARMVWTFARLARSGYRPDEMRAAATHGFRFLADRMWDWEHGGFYWEVDATGARATDADKYLYGESFALYALSEYARLTGDTEARDLAAKTYALIVQHGRDPEFGGYYEVRRRDWSPVPDTQASHVGGPPGAKLMNTHLHLLESFADYYRLTNEARVRDRIAELVTIQSNAVVRKDLTACTDQYRRDWTPILDESAARVSYGHDLENIWLLADATGTIGESNAPLVDLYRRLFAYSAQHGFDATEGGVFNSGPFRADADRREKIWWVQAEALVSALAMYEMTGEDEYADRFEQTWQWVDQHQTDRQHGDWFQEVLPDGSSRGVKADQWKEAYHQVRALIECLDRLERLK